MPEPISTAEIIGDALYDVAGGDGAPHDGPAYERQAHAVLAALATHGRSIVPAADVTQLDQAKALLHDVMTALSWDGRIGHALLTGHDMTHANVVREQLLDRLAALGEASGR
ncbi:hypothetical protein [Nonomuraea dietziae]|uniref:hypothetical protein n=1 Tax=Nonomuraea dietziae TaxID=65515 RepID=UPI003445266C